MRWQIRAFLSLSSSPLVTGPNLHRKNRNVSLLYIFQERVLSIVATENSVFDLDYVLIRGNRIDTRF